MKAEDGAGATTVLTLFDDESELLNASDFGLAVPLGAIVRGVTVEIRARGAGSDPSSMEDRDVLLTPGGAPSGANLERASLSGTFVTRTYGGPSTLWGLSLTPAIVNAASFGVAYRVRYKGIQSGSAEVDVLRVSVSYCE